MSDVFTPQLVLDKAIDHCTAITGGFPISLYPSKIQRIIREVNDCYGFPVDYVAAAMLVAVPVAIGNTHLARMKEGWDESAILYMALIGRPGANKSHPLSFAMRPFVSVIGTMQKRILSELAKGERSANGFIDHILFVLLRHETSTRWSMKQPTFDVAAEWQRILSRLMELQCTVDENNDILPVSIPFTEEAMVRLFKWQHELSDICDRETNETIVGIYCKLQIYAIRFCLIIQMARWACNDAGKDMIDLISVERAISLAEYFKESAVKVQTILKELSLTAQQLAIVSALPQEFETGEGIAIAKVNDMAERPLWSFSKIILANCSKSPRMANISNFSPYRFRSSGSFVKQTAETAKTAPHKSHN